MAQVREYKCPSCGGTLEFNSTIQKMKCSYCGTELEVEALEALNAQMQSERPDEMNWGEEENQNGSWQEGEQEEMRVYVCNSCGGELMTDSTTAATSCPYCGNPVVLTDRVGGTLRPDYVIPFKLDKEAAKAAYKKHLQGKILLPRMFHDENHIDEIKGVYVPYWIFNADADATIRYNGTKKAVWDSGDFVYTRTSVYSIFREGSIRFEHVPVDGSSKIADDLLESIEPFDFSEAVDFRMAYLSGYLADRYDISVKDSIDRANSRIKRSTEDCFESTVSGYQDLQIARSNVRLHNGSYQYALYPVWLLNTTWRGQNFIFAMNGQTGRMVGDLPADTKKLTFWQLGMTAVFSVIAFLIVRLLF